MTEPTADELARWAEEHRPLSWGLCGYCEDEEWPCATTRLLALVTAQADQIAGLRADVAPHLDAARGFAAQANEAEAKIARVRALCDRAEFHAEHGAMGAIWPHDVRAILDGTEGPA